MDMKGEIQMHLRLGGVVQPEEPAPAWRPARPPAPVPPAALCSCMHLTCAAHQPAAPAPSPRRSRWQALAARPSPLPTALGWVTEARMPYLGQHKPTASREWALGLNRHLGSSPGGHCRGLILSKFARPRTVSRTNSH